MRMCYKYLLVIIAINGWLMAAITHDAAINLCRQTAPEMAGHNLEQCVACIKRNDPRIVLDSKNGRNDGPNSINVQELTKICGSCSLYHDITFNNETNYWACINRCRFDTKQISDIGKLNRRALYQCRDCCDGIPTPSPIQFQKDVCPQACADACTEKCIDHGDDATCDEPCLNTCQQKSADYATLYIHDPDEASFKADRCLKNIGDIEKAIADLKQNIDNYQIELSSQATDETTYRYQLDQIQQQSAAIAKAIQASLDNCQKKGVS